VGEVDSELISVTGGEAGSEVAVVPLVSCAKTLAASEKKAMAPTQQQTGQDR
jgi:hypothetical protein